MPGYTAKHMKSEISEYQACYLLKFSHHTRNVLKSKMYRILLKWQTLQKSFLIEGTKQIKSFLMEGTQTKVLLNGRHQAKVPPIRGTNLPSPNTRDPIGSEMIYESNRRANQEERKN